MEFVHLSERGLICVKKKKEGFSAYVCPLSMTQKQQKNFTDFTFKWIKNKFISAKQRVRL